jgi:cytochrome c oxidase subunit 2
VGCTAVIAWTLLFNRAPKYDLDDGDPIEGNIRLEIIWTVIPLVVVLAIAWHTIGVNHTLATLGGKQRLATAAPLENASLPVATGSLPSATDSTEIGPIQVIGRQWSWEFIYPNGVRSSELHLPVDRQIYFRLISMDLLHGFYIPAFRLKQDLIPGSVIDYRLTPSRQGRYRLRDSMFSGGYFATNQTDVVVESEADFAAWLAAAEQAPLRPVLGTLPGEEHHDLPEGDEMLRGREQREGGRFAFGEELGDLLAQFEEVLGVGGVGMGLDEGLAVGLGELGGTDLVDLIGLDEVGADLRADVAGLAPEMRFDQRIRQIGRAHV